MQNYSYYLEKTGEYGEVTEIKYPIVEAVGLPLAKLNEIVVFETGEIGQIFNLKEDSIRIVLLTTNPVTVGTRLSRTNSQHTVSIPEQILGTIINPFGLPISSDFKSPSQGQERLVDGPPPSIAQRKKITKQLVTGTALVDIVIPIGKGQRQLVLGDRKTGKSTFVLTAIKNQLAQGVITIYACIGKKKAELKYLEEFLLTDPKNKKNMIIVATTSFDSPGLIYLTPYTAMTIAEYFRDQGRDVLLVMDDLLTHAKFYRELALLAESFPGRDSYPGNIFHIHAKLLERAGNFIHEKVKEVSISCLPIVETQEADFSGYIVSNSMSITDGHIFFDNNVFAQGRRPAINIPLSVTRVGKQTQSPLLKDINHEVTTLFSEFEKVESLSHFGSDMTEHAKKIYDRGEKIYHFFNQSAGNILLPEIFLPIFGLIWLDVLNTSVEIEDAKIKLQTAYQNPQTSELIKPFFQSVSLEDFLSKIEAKKTELLALIHT